MSQTIVVGVDGTERGRDALALGRLLADAAGAELVAVAVHQIANPEAALVGWANAARAHSERTLRAAIGEGQGVRERIVASSSPARGLHYLAEREHADLIVVGSSHQAGLGRVLVGSVGERVLHGAACGVAVAPAGFRDRGAELKLVCAGFDGTPESEIALEHAIELARSAGASLRVLTVVEPVEMPVAGYGYAFESADELAHAQQELMSSRLERGLALVPGDVDVSGELATVGMPTLVEQDDVDIMVVGSRGYGPIRRVLLGSVSTGLVRNAPYPVIVYPRSAENDDETHQSAEGHARVSQ